MEQNAYDRLSLRLNFASAAMTLGGIVVAAIASPAIAPIAAGVAMMSATVNSETFVHELYREHSYRGGLSLRLKFTAAAAAVLGAGVFLAGSFAGPVFGPAMAVATGVAGTGAGALLHSVYRSIRNRNLF